MSKSQGQSSETHRKPATIEHPRMEMGEHLYGLHCGFAPHLGWVQLDMGRCGLLDYVGPLYTCIHHLQGQVVCRVYMSHIVRYHGILKTIISDRGSIFVARFWEQLHECLGTHLIRSSTCHPRLMDRLSESIKSLKICFVLAF
jgi:hypothetical protein